MAKLQSFIRQSAVSALVQDGYDEASLRNKQPHTLGKYLDLRYPDGSKPNGRKALLMALKSWYETKNRIVTKPYLMEERDRARQERIKQYKSDGKLLTRAAERAAKRVKVDGPMSKEYIVGKAFLQSYEWRQLRMMALKKYGRKCMCCGATPESGAVMNVDHIKPRKLYPNLALDINNLQVICHDCNHGKGNWDMTDWRSEEEAKPVQTFKISKPEQFAKMFDPSNINLKDLPGTPLKLLMVFSSMMDEKNEVLLHGFARQDLEKSLGLQQQSIYNATRFLIKKGLVKRVHNMIYMVNPYVFGKNTGPNVESIRERYDGFSV